METNKSIYAKVEIYPGIHLSFWVVQQLYTDTHSACTRRLTRRRGMRKIFASCCNTRASFIYSVQLVLKWCHMPTSMNPCLALFGSVRFRTNFGRGENNTASARFRQCPPKGISAARWNTSTIWPHWTTKDINPPLQTRLIRTIFLTKRPFKRIC